MKYELLKKFLYWLNIELECSLDDGEKDLREWVDIIETMEYEKLKDLLNMLEDYKFDDGEVNFIWRNLEDILELIKVFR